MKHQQTHGRVWRLLLLVCVLAFSMPAVLVRSQSAADPDGTRQTATPVTLRSDTPGWLGRSDVDYFRVTLSQRGLLHVETTGSTDTKGALRNASGRWLAIDDDSSPNGYNFRIRRTLSAGTYYIRVYGSFTSTTGSYTLQVRFRASRPTGDPGGTRQTATPVTLRSDTTEWLGRGDVDYFRVTLSQRGLLHVETTGSTDTKGGLLNASGRWLAIDDDSSPNGYNFRIRRTLSAGTYYIRVYGSFTSTTGSYTLQVRFRAGSPPPQGALENFDIGVCDSQREVQLCVWDHACEDGDRIRVAVNAGVVFSGEIYNLKTCMTIPVHGGPNTIELTALNETGPQGCDGTPAPPNTGAISIQGTLSGDPLEEQEWTHNQGTGGRATMNVTIGTRGSRCTPLPPDSQGGPVGGPVGGTARWYALATTQGITQYPNCSRWAVSGTARTESEARQEALRVCREDQCAQNCEVENTWRGSNCYAIYQCRNQERTRSTLAWATGPDLHDRRQTAQDTCYRNNWPIAVESGARCVQ